MEPCMPILFELMWYMIGVAMMATVVLAALGMLVVWPLVLMFRVLLGPWRG